MATVRFELTTDLPSGRVLAALTDFTDRRPDLYRNIDRSHFRVHEQGPGWADVTEGNILAWERNRYDWDEGAGRVTVQSTESDSWVPGSRWEYRLEPLAGGGTRVKVTVVRTPRTLRGRLIALALPVVGRGILERDLRQVLDRSR
ncbi:MAG TPA: hypothetical protein VHW91_02555 [Candidatus Dormibacteraeota bacterium]|nr:hypothetical protein [Candidatus Dormibacteraeota bacterium]